MNNASIWKSSVILATAGSVLLALLVPGGVLGNTGEKPPPTSRIIAEAVPQDPVVLAKTEALKEAKRTGDESLARSLGEELGWKVSEDSEQPTMATSNLPDIVIRPELAGKDNKDNTPGTDVQVNYPEWQSSKPTMASTAGGVLFIVVEDATPGNHYLDIYRSDTKGATWYYEFSIPGGGSEVTNPSIAIGEGLVNRILIAYERGAGTANAEIIVFWQDLDSAVNGSVVVEGNINFLNNPQICVDSPEYSYWYPYLTYTKGTLTKQDQYNLMFSRSTTYGDTWQVPYEVASDISAGCRPDIDYGTGKLYIAYSRYEMSYENDIHLLRSSDLGLSWDPELRLSHYPHDESDPCVAASHEGGSVVVAFTREYWEGNEDIDAYYSLDHGDIWSLTYLPWTDFSDNNVDLAVTLEQGRFHAAFWSEHDIHYTWASWDVPFEWAPAEVMNDGGAAAFGIRPTVGSIPGMPQDGCVAWTDTRIELQYNVFFDATYKLGGYMIIIGNEDLYEAVMPLALWKEQLGYNPMIVSVPQIYEAYTTGDDAERIWNFLHDSIPAYKYVLLVGDIDQIPMRILYPDGDPNYLPTDPRHHNGLGYGTDYYYAEHSVTGWDLDGDNRWGEFTDDEFDFAPDLFIGRLPFNDPEPVQAICSNIMTFEQDTGAWKQNALMAHGFLFPSPQMGVPGSDCASMADYMRSQLLTPLGWSSTTLFELGGVGPSIFSCTAALSQANFENFCGMQSQSVVNCNAHGDGGAFYSVRWLYDLNGSGGCDQREEWAYNIYSQRERIPAHPTQSLVFLNGCASAPIIGPDPDFAASPLRSLYLIRNPRHGLAFKDYLLHGAVGVIGTSAGSVGADNWTSPADGGSSSLNYYFYVFLLDLGVPVGEAFQYAQYAYVLNHSLERPQRVFNYYGDPSLVLAGIPEAKRGAPQVAGGSLPGHLDPEAALALASSWRPEASARTYGKSRDEATIWSECAELPGCTDVTSLVQISGGGVIGVGIASGETGSPIGVVFGSSDGWDPWAMINIEGLLSARTILRTDTGALLIGGMAGSPPAEYHGVIFRSNNDGETWNERAGIADGLVTDICQDMAGKLWACSGLNGQIWSSVDDGVNWTIEVGFSSSYELSSIMQASNGRYFATIERNDFFSIIQSDDGQMWYPVGGLESVKSGYEIVEIDGRLYAGVARADGGRVYRSDDLSGETWNPLAAFPAVAGAVAVRSVAVDWENRLYAGISVSQAANTTRVYAMDPAEMVWREYGGGVDLADRVTAILPVSGAIFIGTGCFNGNIYRCAGPEVAPVPDEDGTPNYRFMMSQNFPNPFNPSTTICFELAEASTVQLSIYDVSGRLLRMLVSTDRKEAGRHEVLWDGRDDTGRLLPTGVYFYRLDAGQFSETKRMVLIK